MKNSQKGLHVCALAIGGEGENLTGFLPESSYSGPVYCSKPLAKLGYLEHVGWEDGYHAHFL